MAAGKDGGGLYAVVDAIDRDHVHAVWRQLCRADRVLGSGQEVPILVETLDAFVEALYEPYEFEEGIPELTDAAQSLFAHAGSGGIATRQLLALAEALARLENFRDANLRAEYDRRLRHVLGTFVLYVNLQALGEIDREARRDPLTGLHNRRAFDSETERLYDKRADFSVVVVDVDGLKDINDRDGHEAGDELLKRVATTLAEACADGEYAYRFGGDEYAYVSTVRTADEIEELMRGLSTESTPFSWGVARYPAEGDAIDVVMNLADQRMYKRKRVRKGSLGACSALKLAQRAWSYLRSSR